MSAWCMSCCIMWKFEHYTTTRVAGVCTQVKVEAEEGDDDEDMDNDDSSDDEEVVVPEGVDVDPAVLSTLPPSMQVRHTIPDILGCALCLCCRIASLSLICSSCA